ncbi:hypothetical protein B0E54_04504 [Micromonospora sp. MH99]|nr:hypothetical protein [Micromonospora sp. MH99]
MCRSKGTGRGCAGTRPGRVAAAGKGLPHSAESRRRAVRTAWVAAACGVDVLCQRPIDALLPGPGVSYTAVAALPTTGTIDSVGVAKAPYRESCHPDPDADGGLFWHCGAGRAEQLGHDRVGTGQRPRVDPSDAPPVRVESRHDRHGTLTHHVLRALRGAAADDDERARRGGPPSTPGPSVALLMPVPARRPRWVAGGGPSAASLVGLAVAGWPSFTNTNLLRDLGGRGSARVRVRRAGRGRRRRPSWPRGAAPAGTPPPRPPAASL